MSILNSLVQLDGNLLIGIQQSLNADWLTQIMKAVTFLGEAGWASILLSIVFMCCRRTRKLGILCAVTVAFTFICCSGVIKPAVGRARPWEMFPEVQRMIPDPGDSSFPSGHTANCMTFAFSIWLNTLQKKRDRMKDWTDGPRLGWKDAEADRKLMHRFGNVAIVLACLVGLSRIYLGMHFPSDVLGGAVLGMLGASIVYTINIKLEKKSGIINQCD